MAETESLMTKEGDCGSSSLPSRRSKIVSAQEAILLIKDGDTVATDGFCGAAPRLSRFVIENKIEAYNFPQGVISHMFRDVAAHKPRTITTIGLETFVDPRYGGGKANRMTTEDLVEFITFDGKEYLAYKTFPIDVALLRGIDIEKDILANMEFESVIKDPRGLWMGEFSGINR